MRPLTAAWLLAALGALAAPASPRAQLVADAYERAPTIEPATIVPRQALRSGHHRFADEVTLDGHIVTFVIESEFGRYRVRSLPLALVRVREIDVLAQAIDHFNRSNQRLAGELRGRLEVGAESFVDILTSPLSTATNVVGQFTRNVGKTFEEFGEFPDPDKGALARRPEPKDPYLRFEPGDPILASHRRSVARQLGLDVYSSNPRVQDFLDTVAAARSSGRSSAGVLSVSRDRVLAPVDGGRIDESVDALLARNPVEELRREGKKRLAELGVDAELAQRFMNHPALSPRHRASLIAYLEFLSDVEGRDALLRSALRAGDEVAALASVQAARMLARYHEQIEPLARVFDAGDVLVAGDREWRLVAVMPFDLIFWDRETDRTFSGLARFASERNYGSLELLVTGVLTERARRQLGRLGYRIHEHFLLGS